MENPYLELEKIVGISLKNVDLYHNAFTHKSYLNENRHIRKSDNERLEFLGDAVLELIVTEFLYLNYPDPEGVLTNWRSALVKKETLAGIARELDLGKYLFLSKGENATGGRDKDYILANTFEAFLGALYLDHGFDIAKKFVTEKLLIRLEGIISDGLHIDAKSNFQEIAQEKTGITPNYLLLKEEGPDHDKIFTMGAYLNGELCGQGSGSNKQSAEQSAARDALAKQNWETKKL